MPRGHLELLDPIIPRQYSELESFGSPYSGHLIGVLNLVLV